MSPSCLFSPATHPWGCQSRVCPPPPGFRRLRTPAHVCARLRGGYEALGRKRAFEGETTSDASQGSVTMRTSVALIVAAIIVASFAAPLDAQQPPPQPAPGQVRPHQPQQPAAPPGPRRIVPGEVLAGVQVGARMTNVLSRFGAPSQVIDTALDTVYVFSRFGITAYSKGGIVTAASGTNSLLKINDALGVGHRVEDVLAMFGRGYREGEVEGFPGLIYDRRGIAFGLDGRGVAAVLVFGANTASIVSGLTPG